MRPGSCLIWAQRHTMGAMEPKAAPIRTEPAVDRLLTADDLRTRFTLSRTTVFRWRRMGLFPDPIRLGPARVAWRESDIAAWLAARMTNESAPPIAGPRR